MVLLASGRVHRDALRDVVWLSVVPEIGITSPERTTPVFRIAVTTAILIAASAHLVRPLQRIGWSIVALAVLAGSGLGFGLPSDAVGAVGLGLIAAGTTSLLLGHRAACRTAGRAGDEIALLALTTDGTRLDRDHPGPG